MKPVADSDAQFYCELVRINVEYQPSKFVMT